MQPLAAVAFLLDAIVGLYIYVILLRFLLQLVRADFYNPLSQAIVKATSPLLVPLRRVIPPIGKVDSASILLALLVQALLLLGLVALQGSLANVSPLLFALWTPVAILDKICSLYLLSLLVLVISSFVAPFSRHPALVLVRQLTEPLLRPIRSILPPLGGLDFSVYFAGLFIYAFQQFILP